MTRLEIVVKLVTGYLTSRAGPCNKNKVRELGELADLILKEDLYYRNPTEKYLAEEVK